MSPAYVLLIPADGDPLGLLGEGPCEARPPMACCPKGPGRRGIWFEGRLRSHLRGVTALVLVWGGKRDSRGIFTAWYQADDVGSEVLMEALYDDEWTPDDIARIVREWRRDGRPLGTVVLLDADRREIGGEG